MRVLPIWFICDQGWNLLLLHRIDRKTWEPVKWSIEWDESEYEAVIRELYEETGIHERDIFKIDKIFESETSWIAQIWPQSTLHKVVFHIVISWIKPNISINHIQEWGCDHDSYWRFVYNELESLDIEYKEFFYEMIEKIIP